MPIQGTMGIIATDRELVGLMLILHMGEKGQRGEIEGGAPTVRGGLPHRGEGSACANQPN